MLVESVEAMRDLGAKLATHLQPGDIVVLRGNLGAGKTALTQGIGRYLGVNDVTSPTFVISRTHKAKIPLIHVDAYRLLGSASQGFEIDDLAVTTDFRDIYASLLEKVLGTPAERILGNWKGRTPFFN